MSLIRQLGPAADTKSSVYAEEGTAMHEMASHCLLYSRRADEYIGDKFNGFVMDEDHAAAVMVYVETIHSDWLDDGGEMKVEVRFDISSAVGADMWGTADCCLISDKLLRVYDFKGGRGITVNVENTTQLMIYELGALRSLATYDIEEIELIIVQPRKPHRDGPVRRSKRIKVIDVAIDFTNAVIDAVQATKAPDAPLRAGDHCTFCPARGQCPELKNHALNTMHADFDGSLPAATLLTPLQIGELMNHVDLLDEFVRSVKERAQQIAESGVEIPGWKLVPKRATRKWINEGALPLFLGERLGMTTEQIYEMKIRSPNKMDKQVPAAKRKELEPLYERVSSGNTLVPVTDARSAVRASIQTDFQPIRE